MGLRHSQGAALPPLSDPGPCGLLICCVTPPEPSSSSYQGLPLLWVLERGSPARTPHCSAVTSTARPSPSPLQPPQTMQAATGSACPRPTPTQASRHAGKNPSHPKTLGEVLRSQERQKHEHSFSLESSKSTRSLTWSTREMQGLDPCRQTQTKHCWVSPSAGHLRLISMLPAALPQAASPRHPALGVPALESLASAAGEQSHPAHSSVLLRDAPTPQVLPNLRNVSTPAVPFQPGRPILAKTHRAVSCDPSSQTCESLMDECVCNSTRNPMGLRNKINR